MTRSSPRRPRPPLDRQRLEEMALRYVGRFATTRAKLSIYLQRKLRERGWAETAEPDVDGIAQRFAELGYIDDAAYALAKSRALTDRGFGTRRLNEKLRVAGVEEPESRAARAHAEANAVDSALRFAERRRIGPFAAAAPDPKQREKAMGAMVRAGHGFALARAIVALPPGAEVDREALGENAARDA